MAVPMMCIGRVRVGVLHRLVAMIVPMLRAMLHRVVVLMLVMIIVLMLVIVCQRLASTMRMGMMLSQMQPRSRHPDTGHQQLRQSAPRPSPTPEQRQKTAQSRSTHRCVPSPNAAADDKQRDAHPIGQEPNQHGAADDASQSRKSSAE